MALSAYPLKPLDSIQRHELEKGNGDQVIKNRREQKLLDKLK